MQTRKKMTDLDYEYGCDWLAYFENVCVSRFPNCPAGKSKSCQYISSNFLWRNWNKNKMKQRTYSSGAV